MGKVSIEFNYRRKMTKLGERMNEGQESGTGSKQILLPELANEVMKLLQMRMDELLGTLGGQLLGCGRPSRTAGMFSFLSAAESASKARNLFGYPLAVSSSSEWSEGVQAICDELRREGTSFFEGISYDLRAALNDNEEILQMSEHINRSGIHVILMVIGAILKLPRELESVSATVTAILLKQGLRNFCRKELKSAV
jgi:hypothetical protein